MSSPSTLNSLLIAPTILFSISIVLFALRIYTRYARGRLAVDDLLLSAAMAAALGLYIICTVSVVHGAGQHVEDLSPKQVSLLACLQLFNAEFYVWTSTFIKLALAVMLLRIQSDHLHWRIGLYALMVFILALAVASCLWDYLQCIPIRALWDLSYPRNYCSLHAFRRWIYVASTLFLLTDLLLALLPILFIRKLALPLRSKLVLYFLMALGVTCAASIIPKLVALQSFTDRGDFTYSSAGTMLWSQIEVYTGIIAVCIPVLKNAAERGLRRMGLLTSSSGGRGSEWGTTAAPSVVKRPDRTVLRTQSYEIEEEWVHDHGVVSNDQWTWLNLGERSDDER